MQNFKESYRNKGKCLTEGVVVAYNQISSISNRLLVHLFRYEPAGWRRGVKKRRVSDEKKADTAERG